MTTLYNFIKYTKDYEPKGKTKASLDGRHVGLDSFSFIK